MSLPKKILSSPVVGWIGLGKMGLPMARNLANSGYKLVVFDIDKKPIKELTDEYVKEAKSPGEVASESDIIISIIPDDSALAQISFGPEGVFEGAKPNSIFVDMSTVSVKISEQVSEKCKDNRINYLRAPVSGSTIFAKLGKLTVLASGPRDSYDKCVELFDIFAEKHLYIGESEEARYAKLVVNMMVGISAAMIAEALTFGKRGGLDWIQMLEIIDSSVVSSPLLGFKIPPLKKRDFTPAFTASQMAKDIDLVLDTGNQMNTAMPLTAMLRQFLNAMEAKGNGNLDYFGLVTLWEEMSGI